MKIGPNSKEFNILTYILAAESDNSKRTHEHLMDLFGGSSVNGMIIEGILRYDDHSDNLLITEYGYELLENVELPLGKNYTQPEDPDHEDDPEEWLSSSLIFAKALGKILREHEGIVIKLEGDMKILWPTVDKVIVANYDGMIHVINCEEDVKDGQLVWLDTPSDIEDGD
jgi:hypothetical protein